MVEAFFFIALYFVLHTFRTTTGAVRLFVGK